MTLDKLKAELERAREKSALWQARVKDLERQVTHKENQQILRDVRSITASPEELRELLGKIRTAKEPPESEEDTKHED